MRKRKRGHVRDHTADPADRPELLGDFIDGNWRPTESGRTRPDVNPADASDVIGEFAESGGADADDAVEAAARAWPAWRELGPIARAEIGRAACRGRGT